MQGTGFRAPTAGGAELWDGCVSMGFEVRTNLGGVSLRAITEGGEWWGTC